MNTGAIKCVPKTHKDYEGFRKEALILKELRHPGIPLVYDMEEDSHYFYLIEEYLEGNSLYDLIKDQGPFQEAEAVRYGRQICSLVEYLHHSCDKPMITFRSTTEKSDDLERHGTADRF